MSRQRGGLVLGLVVGLLVGLAVALAVALYVTKAPIPFVNKVPPRTADHDAAEAERNRNWDPNAGLLGKSARPAEGAASGAASAPGGTRAAAPAARDPAAILAGAPVPAGPAASGVAVAKAPPTLPPAVLPPAAGASAPRSAKSAAEPFIFFVQAGAFQSSDEAEQQRARLAMLGVETKLIEREQSGRTVFRVRAGPFTKQGEAEAVRDKLTASNVEALLVRVERQP